MQSETDNTMVLSVSDAIDIKHNNFELLKFYSVVCSICSSYELIISLFSILFSDDSINYIQ